METRALVARIIPFSSVDGPGNRTAIFLQGCNIDCKYCHNPETRGDDPNARLMSVAEVMSEVKKNIPFIRGVTVSGGECMLQPGFLTALFGEGRGLGLTCLIDSNGTIPFDNFPDLMDVTDGVMLDIKAFDDRAHIEITGHTNRTVLENAVFLAERSKLTEVRCVITESLYSGEDSLRGIGELLSPYNRVSPFRIKLITYRPMGVRSEYLRLMKVPPKSHMERLKEVIQSYGFSDVVIV